MSQTRRLMADEALSEHPLRRRLPTLPRHLERPLTLVRVARLAGAGRRQERPLPGLQIPDLRQADLRSTVLARLVIFFSSATRAAGNDLLRRASSQRSRRRLASPRIRLGIKATGQIRRSTDPAALLGTSKRPLWCLIHEAIDSASIA